MNKIVFFIGILLVLLFTGCIDGGDGRGNESDISRGGDGPDFSYNVIYFPDGTPITLEVMRTPEEQFMGLMFREGIGENEGMLFYSKRDHPAGEYLFFMKNMKFPIDMIWLDKDFKIVYIERNAPPCTTEPCPEYGPPDVVSRHVLEVKANLSSRHGLKVGDTLRVEG
jgi:uncharacterized protein